MSGERGRGGGRGQNRGGGNQGKGNQPSAQTVKNLERAARDVQNLMQKLSLEHADPAENTCDMSEKNPRGSKSMMDLSNQGCARGQGPKRGGHQRPNSRSNDNFRNFNRNQFGHGPQGQSNYNQGPPDHCNLNQHQGPYNQHPFNQGPYNQGPFNQGPHGQGPFNQGPRNQGPYNQGPRHQGPYNQGPRHQGPYNQGPRHQGPYNQGPRHQGNYNQGPRHQGNYNQEMHRQGSYNQGLPPPSYEESNLHYGTSLVHDPPPNQKQDKFVKKKCTKSKLNAGALVKEIALFDGQMATAERLSRQVQSSIGEIEEVVKQRQDVFSYMNNSSGMLVELVPKVKLCSKYLSEEGCTARDTCQNLHICKDYLLAHCAHGPSCPLGHKFDTNHNGSVLSKVYLDLIDKRPLLNVLRKVFRGNVPPKVCSFYNSRDGCRKGDSCHFLHICKDYVINTGNCSIKDCSYSHQLNSKHCRNVLTKSGISTNETTRDILLSLKSYLQKSNDQPSVRPAAAACKKVSSDESSEDSSDSSDLDDSCHATGVSNKKKVKSKSNKKGKCSTIRSLDVYGDVKIPEICVYAVNDNCRNEKSGCPYLHAKSLFHWQVERDNKWYNLRIFQSKALESAYRDVSRKGTKLPAIDLNKMSSEDKMMLEVVGTSSWIADFKRMCITDPPAQAKLNIRRVSTPSSAVSNIPQATVYDWYFVDNQDKWIRYGHVDSLGNQDHVCNVTSEEIEKQYLSNPSSTMKIQSAHFSYALDFAQMKQTNLISEKVREIRRRPSRLSCQKDSNEKATPTHWLAMTPNQTHLLVTLDASHTEYQDVSKWIRLMIPSAKIQQIKRLQNEYLWRLLQYKKADLSRRYDDDKMNIQKLFHGTDKDSIDAICKENIDGRRYANNKEKFGKGTYFSNSPAVARTYCTPDANGHFFLIIAQVIIGEVILGSKGLNRPPLNAATGAQYDTTVDNVQAPTVFVKYDKEDYYPEYIVEVA